MEKIVLYIDKHAVILYNKHVVILYNKHAVISYSIDINNFEREIP